MSSFDYPTTGERLNNAQREQLLDQVKQQVALASAQELIQKMSDKCFKKCVNKPGTSLDSSEQKCLAMCMDRYMDTWNLISRTYSSRLQREHGAGSSFQ
ncbi:mitochondrial import inner membrane translocase subunit Tim13-like [Dendronephthya gigantea]|uniref:mitochondrial import inner membrane translocase subunit Tim13-like n=1 Tax=Dendronephthya gigantea TaxID=151771 RepID=UPI00106B5661|nr:mitochondrial import inner membrane translocase subunit Tim13-like [Dendronephthya gigantea]